MDLSIIKQQKPTRENWFNIVKSLATQIENGESIAWEATLNALAKFPDELRNSQQYTTWWSKEGFEPLLQLFTLCKIHRTTHTAKFSKLCASPYSANIKGIAIDYREGDEDWVHEGAFVSATHFTKLEKLRLKNFPFASTEFMENIDNYPKLSHVDLIHENASDHLLANFLRERGMTVIQSRSAYQFKQDGYDFW